MDRNNGVVYDSYFAKRRDADKYYGIKYDNFEYGVVFRQKLPEKYSWLSKWEQDRKCKSYGKTIAFIFGIWSQIRKLVNKIVDNLYLYRYSEECFFVFIKKFVVDFEETKSM